MFPEKSKKTHKNIIIHPLTTGSPTAFCFPSNKLLHRHPPWVLG